MTMTLEELDLETIEFVPAREVMCGGGCYSYCEPQPCEPCDPCQPVLECNANVGCLDVTASVF